MTNTDIQLKTAFEQEKMTPEEIASDFGYDVVAVKAKLIQVSAIYRREAGMDGLSVVNEEDDLNFTNNQLRDINGVMYNIAMNSPDERLQFDACKYIRDDKKGRKEVVKAIQNGPSINMIQFNNIVKQAREQTEKLRGTIQLEKQIA